MSESFLDRADRRLLRALQRDCNKPLVDLADQLGLSRSACSRRVQRLHDSGFIRAQVALLDAKRLGLPLTVFIAIKTNQHNEVWSRQFQNVVEGLPGILEAHRMGGEVDYLLKAAVADMAGYDALYQQLIATDPFDVSSSFVIVPLNEHTVFPIP